MEKENEELSEDVISSDVEDVNNIRSISKELFTGKNIQGKTELSAKQINAISRVRFMNRWLNNDVDEKGELLTVEKNMNKLVEDIEILSASFKRKSREEFVKTMQIQNAQSNKESFWGKLGGAK